MKRRESQAAICGDWSCCVTECYSLLSSIPLKSNLQGPVPLCCLHSASSTLWESSVPPNSAFRRGTDSFRAGGDEWGWNRQAAKSRRGELQVLLQEIWSSGILKRILFNKRLKWLVNNPESLKLFDAIVSLFNRLRGAMINHLKDQKQLTN